MAISGMAVSTVNTVLRLGIQAGTGAPEWMPPQPPNSASVEKARIAR